jgi:hypothetical protein
MHDLLFWLYFVNSVALINHEIDSAYWKEWELFRLPGGIAGFLLLHVPIVAFVLYGLIQVHERSFAGLIFSLVLCIGGIFAFFAHRYFLNKGRPEFNTVISKALLLITLIVSVVQTVVTVYVMTR